MKTYTAIINGSRIISVRAKSEDEARKQVEIELSKPGRRTMICYWMQFGSVLEVSD